MTYEFIVAIRNDQGQILVLEALDSRPLVPGGELMNTPQLKTIAQKVRSDTGLDIRGLHLTSTRKEGGREVHRYTAAVAGGQLHLFPSADFRSASWVAPGLVVRLSGASKDLVELIRDLAFTHVRAP